MFNIKIVSILFTLICIASINVYAGNIGRNVYGVLTETYNGVSIDNTAAGEDYAHIYGSSVAETDDKIEGSQSVAVSSGGWFGVYFYAKQNMSSYEGGKIYFSLKVPTSVNIDSTSNLIKISDTSDKIIYFNSTNIKRIDNGSSVLGTKILADNNWHTYYIELSSFTGLDFSNIQYPFIITSEKKDGTLLVDNVYWAKNSSGSFDVLIKNRTNNTTTNSVSWSESAFRQGWIAAQQYLELDLDMPSTNWYVQIYADNGKKERNGLYATKEDGTEIVLTMAWRIHKDLLPSNGDTLIIAQQQEEPYGLYDAGKNPEGTDWYTWAYMKEKNDDLDDYTKVWTLNGYHAVVGGHDSWDTLANNYSRKPKIYLAADCSKALGGLEYTSKIVVRLSYE